MSKQQHCVPNSGYLAPPPTTLLRTSSGGDSDSWLSDDVSSNEETAVDYLVNTPPKALTSYVYFEKNNSQDEGKRGWCSAHRIISDVQSQDHPRRFSPPPRSITCATWNVWFGNDRSQLDTIRFQALADELRTHKPHVICLQEVTAPILTFFLRQTWIRKHYWSSEHPQHLTSFGSCQYGVVILSRLPLLPSTLHCQTLPSLFTRRYVYAVIRLSTNVTLFVGTAHLESYSDSDAIRKHQLAVIRHILEEHRNEDCQLHLGDCNFDSAKERKDATHILGMQDVWKTVHGSTQPGYTVDPKRNSMLVKLQAQQKTKTHEKQERIDMIYMQRSTPLMPTRCQLLGTKPIAPQLFPSDHFGVRATFKLK